LPKNQEFVSRLKKDSEGYPVFFHLNASRKEVDEVLLKSRFYWHATGYGEDEERNPLAFEHFGIAPVEAISAGCIPVLYRGGGLKEIVSRLGLGEECLFGSTEELAMGTKKMIDRGERLPDKTFRALKEIFSFERFGREFLEIVS
jgi:glycosyltransferase involved in cell wall biosynthesis